MTKALILVLPNFNIPFIVECDASDTGIGVILMQTNPLHTLAPTLSTYEKELMTLILAIQKSVLISLDDTLLLELISTGLNICENRRYQLRPNRNGLSSFLSII